MSQDKYEGQHRTPAEKRRAVEMMANADFGTTQSLAAAMGLLRCIHGFRFPCAQCRANRSWNPVSQADVDTCPCCGEVAQIAQLIYDVWEDDEIVLAGVCEDCGE